MLGGTVNNLGCRSMTIGGTADHVHLLLQLAKTLSVADAVGRVKSATSAWVNQTRGLPAEFHWQTGYAAFSVSQSNVESVRDYVRRQAEHRAQRSFQDELHVLLQRYEIEWDERYVWD